MGMSWGYRGWQSRSFRVYQFDKGFLYEVNIWKVYSARKWMQTLVASYRSEHGVITTRVTGSFTVRNPVTSAVISGLRWGSKVRFSVNVAEDLSDKIHIPTHEWGKCILDWNQEREQIITATLNKIEEEHKIYFKSMRRWNRLNTVGCF